MTTTPTVWKSDFIVNDIAPLDDHTEQNGRVVGLANGGWVVIWEDDTSGTVNAIAQIYDFEGNTIGGENSLGLLPSVHIFDLSIDALPNGGFVITHSDSLFGHMDVVADTYNSAGTKTTTVVIAGSISDEHESSVTAFADGSYMVVYNDNDDIKARFVNAGGVAMTPFTINNEADAQTFPDITTLANGNFVAVFSNQFNGSAADLDVEFYVYQTNGTLVANGIISGAGDGATETNAAVAGLTGGGFVAVWQDSDGDGTGNTGIRASIYNNTGGLVIGNIQVNTTTADAQHSPRVTGLDDGGFVVVWDDDNAAQNATSGQRFDATGVAIGSEFQMTIGLSTTADVDVAVLTDGRFIAINTSAGDDVHATVFDPRDGTLANPINGTNGNDNITSRVDGGVVYGFGGQDHIVGGAGADTIDGGNDVDTVEAGAGNDRVIDNDGFSFDRSEERRVGKEG